MFKKSGRKKRDEIKRRRLERARLLAEMVTINGMKVPPGVEKADPEKLTHVEYWHQIPEYYKDTEFRCIDCGDLQVWTAKQQKWWYEIAKGSIDSKAVRCRPCRKKRRVEQAEHRRRSLAGMRAMQRIVLKSNDPD